MPNPIQLLTETKAVQAIEITPRAALHLFNQATQPDHKPFKRGDYAMLEQALAVLTQVVGEYEKLTAPDKPTEGDAPNE